MPINLASSNGLHDKKTMDWFHAAKHLYEVRKKCVESGSGGVEYLVNHVNPLKYRLEGGERSEELMNEIMKLNY